MTGRIAFAAGAAIVGLELLALALWAGSRFATPGYVFMRSPWPMLGLMVTAGAQAVAGLILVTRRPGNRVGWVIVGYALAVSCSVAIMGATAREPDAARSDLLRWITWAGNSFLFPLASWFAFAAAFIFPSGRLAASAWRLPFVGVTAASIVAAVLIAIRPGPLLFFPLIENPLALHGLTGALTPSGAEAMRYTAVPLLLLSLAAAGSGASLAIRYLRATGDLRVQIRWYIAAGVLLAFGYAAQLVALLLLGPRDPRGELIEIVNHVVAALPPIAMTIAILRYRLYDIDVILNRAFVYGALTALLAGLYTAGIRFFNTIFTEATGERSDLALVITTLLLATTFTPIKGRLEGFAARRLTAASPSGARDAPSGRGATGSSEEAATALLADPAFVAAVDARVAAALADRVAQPASTGTSPPRRQARRAGAGGSDPAATPIPEAG